MLGSLVGQHSASNWAGRSRKAPRTPLSSRASEFIMWPVPGVSSPGPGQESLGIPAVGWRGCRRAARSLQPSEGPGLELAPSPWLWSVRAAQIQPGSPSRRAGWGACRWPSVFTLLSSHCRLLQVPRFSVPRRIPCEAGEGCVSGQTALTPDVGPFVRDQR